MKNTINIYFKKREIISLKKREVTLKYFRFKKSTSFEFSEESFSRGGGERVIE